MEATGILIAILPEQSGQTEKGTWVKGGFVIETKEEYSKKIAFTLFGQEKINKIKEFSIGQMLNVQFSAQSREWQGRWFTELNCFRVKAAYPQQPAYSYQQPIYQPQPTQPQPQPQAYQQPPFIQPAYQQPAREVMQEEYGDNGSNNSDDLPF